MMSVLGMIAVWALFIATHVGLSADPLRSSLVRRFGERGFLAIYGLIAWGTFGFVVAYYSLNQSAGPLGPNLGAEAAVGAALRALVVTGVVMMTAAFAPRGYWESPAMILTTSVRPPFGMERITRHPFFSGLVLFAMAHALLAPRLLGTLFFAGFVLLATVGPMPQGRKLLQRHGEAYAAYLRQTSAIPFLAILAGRQKLVASEIPWPHVAGGLLIALALRQIHGWLFYGYGILFLAGLIGFTTYIGIRGVRQRAQASGQTTATQPSAGNPPPAP